MQTLDAEIAIYRKLLEGEETRVGLRLLVERQLIEQNSLKTSARAEEDEHGRHKYPYLLAFDIRTEPPSAL